MSIRRSQIVLGLILVASTLTLTPLAYADPPDPTWVTGFWDDDDFDDVVGYITSAAGWLPAPVAGDLLPAELPTSPRQVSSLVAVSALRTTSCHRAHPTPI